MSLFLRVVLCEPMRTFFFSPLGFLSGIAESHDDGTMCKFQSHQTVCLQHLLFCLLLVSVGTEHTHTHTPGLVHGEAVTQPLSCSPSQCPCFNSSAGSVEELSIYSLCLVLLDT